MSLLLFSDAHLSQMPRCNCRRRLEVQGRRNALWTDAKVLLASSCRQTPYCPLLDRRTAFPWSCACVSAYLADALQPVAGLPGRQRLRSSSTSALTVPMTRLFMIGDRAFIVTAARTWSSLPSEVTSLKCLRTFKIKLKNHLFSCEKRQLIVKWLRCHWHFLL